MSTLKLGEKHTSMFGWSREATYEGETYVVKVTRGKRVLIPYKPRGKNIGYWWNASIYNITTQKAVDNFRVSKSLGCRGILVDAGVIEGKASQGSFEPGSMFGPKARSGR